MTKVLRIARKQRSLSLADCGDVLTVEQLARVLVIGRNAAYQLVAEKRIHAASIGRSLRIPKSAVIAFLEAPEKASTG